MKLPQKILRAVVVPLLLIPISLPGGSTLDTAVSAQVSRSGEECRNEGKPSSRDLSGRFVPGTPSVGELLSEAISSLLDCREQQQAAGATQEAVRGGVGSGGTWQSETRANVTGLSQVTEVRPSSANGECVSVIDILAIEGEETRDQKLMCRRPPYPYYSRV